MNVSRSMNNTDYDIVCVTLNPALDLTGHLPNLCVGELNRVNTANMHAAGKGINVAKLLSQLGAKVAVSGFLGSMNEADFTALFSRFDLADHFVRVSGSTRINVKLALAQQENAVTEVNFPSFSVDEAAFAQLRETLLGLAKCKPLFVIAGSLPTGVSAQRCSELISDIQALGARVVFDSSKAALKAGVHAAPFLVKPNQQELSELTGQPISELEQVLDAATTLYQQGCANVVVSLGAQGAVWLNAQGALLAIPPKMKVMSTVGAGDSLVAGLCWGELNQWSKQASLLFATALSALAVSQVNVGLELRKDAQALQELSHQVVLQSL